MINVITEALDAVRKAASDQSQRIQNELNSAIDAINAEKVAFSTAMQNVAKLRADADRQQAEAMRALDTQFTQFTAILVALQNQIGAGEIVTGADPPVPHFKPKLKSVA